jgi:hypothetical protein
LIKFTQGATDIQFSGDYNPVEYLLKILGNEQQNEPAENMGSQLGDNAKYAKITDCLIENNIQKFKQDYGDQDAESFSDLEVQKNYSPGFLVQSAFLAGRNVDMTFR